ncbi:MAG TPA: hypothetical protein VLJ17_20295 [Xanthobacteraceae bacterium]|nr:hypothetical protein [Xanthobacteraceae bacterium]
MPRLARVNCSASLTAPFVRFALKAAIEGRLTRPDAVLDTHILVSALISPVGHPAFFA